jgi:hypothetical protein
MTRAEIDLDRAAALTKLRERPSLSRAAYAAEKRRIDHEHAGRIDQLVRSLDTVPFGGDQVGSAGNKFERRPSRTSRKPEIADLAETATNQPLIVPKRVRGRPRIEALPDVATNLTAKQRAFAEHYVALGGKAGVGSAAARAAGYAEASADVQSDKLLKHSGVLDYIKHLSRQCLRAGAALGTATMVEIAETGTPADAVRLKAATALVAHAGLAPIVQTENRTVIEHTLNRAALVTAWAALEAAVGQPLGSPPMIDVTPFKDGLR